MRRSASLSCGLAFPVLSHYVKDEASWALKRQKLVPVVIDDVELPFRFEGIHTPSLVDWDDSKDAPAFLGLVDDIAAIVGYPPNKQERHTTGTVKPRAPKPEPRQKAKEISEPHSIFRDTLKDGS